MLFKHDSIPFNPWLFIWLFEEGNGKLRDKIFKPWFTRPDA
jgi:hypothetical protein